MAVFIASYGSEHPSKNTVYIIISMHGGGNNIQAYKKKHMVCMRFTSFHLS